MTSTAIRKKVHAYIDEADENLVEVIYKLLEVYRSANNSSLTDEKQSEVLSRAAGFKNGSIKSHSLSEVKSRFKRN